MLIEFKFSNYRSFRDEGCLSMEATGLRTKKRSLIPCKPTELLPAAAIFGKNGGGKSNVIRAFWLGAQFIRNAQRTQHENAPVPVQPFLLNDDSMEEPASFEYTYVRGGVKYIYGFSATRKSILREYLYHTPKGQKALIFSREGQEFTFRENSARKLRELIQEAVNHNQLYFSVACTMNEPICKAAMGWFREDLFFSRDYADIPEQLLMEYSEQPNMIKAITRYAVEADIGVEDIRFEVENEELDENNLPDEMPEEIKNALTQFIKALSAAPNDSETTLKMGQMHATSLHRGLNRQGEHTLYQLSLAEESDGTKKLMAMAPAVEQALERGGVLLVDELESGMHPILAAFLVSKFQSPDANPNHAQLIFTTHNLELLDEELLRKDQIYFVDKDRDSGVSSLYSISEFSTPTTENLRKGYLLGKYGATPDITPEEVW